ncbi:MAG: hypothetical protein ABIZ80_01230, partial [Bryobacteraceae bacterium]
PPPSRRQQKMPALSAQNQTGSKFFLPAIFSPYRQDFVIGRSTKCIHFTLNRFGNVFATLSVRRDRLLL